MVVCALVLCVHVVTFCAISIACVMLCSDFGGFRGKPEVSCNSLRLAALDHIHHTLAF